MSDLLDDYLSACKRLLLVRDLIESLDAEAREHSVRKQYHSARVKFETAEKIRRIVEPKR